MGRLTGRSAVITGAASGIGRAAAKIFAAEGASLVIADRAEEVNDTAKAVTDAGGKAVAVTGDAGDEAFVQSLVARAQSEHGGLDVFWANAGISGGWVELADQTTDYWSEILRVNLLGPFLAIKHASAAMIPQGRGSIIMTASVAGIRSGAGGLPYSASKAGVINLVKVAAVQLCDSNIRVNAICPGLIETGMTEMIYKMARDAGRESMIGNLNPLKRGGEPDEIAQAALFLASDEASYVNGHALVVDGGLTSSHPYARQRFGQTAT